MKNRLVFGILMSAAIVGLFVADAKLAGAADPGSPLGFVLARGLILPLLAMALLLWGTLELDRLLRTEACRPHLEWAMLSVVALCVTAWVFPFDLRPLLMALAAAVLGLGVLQALTREVDHASADASATLLMIGYVGLLGSFFVRLRAQTVGTQGAYLLLLFLIATKFTDIGAFFIGSAVGRHKLIPRVSPKKSVEGFVGGLICGLLAGMTFWRFGPVSSDGFVTVSAQWWEVALTLLVVGVMGQLGDLFESALKRSATAKDSGAIVPSFGGILDIIDSPLFSIPSGWIMMEVLGGIG